MSRLTMKTGPSLGGGHFQAGYWRPDAPTGEPVDDIGPKPPAPDERPHKGTPMSPARNPHTVANLQRRADSLALRRFSWESGE